MSFTLEHDPVDAGHLVVADGELDITATNELSTVLAMAGASPERSVVLDLLNVDFIDSSALGVIMRAAGELETTGKILLVVAPDGPVRRLLEITNLTQRFALHPTRGTRSRLPPPGSARHGRRHRGLDGHRRSVGPPSLRARVRRRRGRALRGGRRAGAGGRP